MITIALTKGRITENIVPLLKKINLGPMKKEGSHALVLTTPREDVRILELRGIDVPVYVDIGAADLGIVGKDLLMEYEYSDRLYELADLKQASCRLATIRKIGSARAQRKIRVATKYINTAKRYYEEHRIEVELIKLYGSMELAPMLGVAEEIVDIVDTGNTIKAHNLEIVDIIATSSVRLCANPTSMRLKYGDIQDIVEAIKACL